MEVYHPAEDSYLLAKYVEKLVDGKVLDMGTGSGIQAVTAAKKTEVISVLAVDLNPEALLAAEKMAKNEGVDHKVSYLLSDLFENVKSHFDWIIFNTPYLPSEGEADEVSWVGGPTGSETIKRFIKEATKHLAPGGSILILYSSFSNIEIKDLDGFDYDLLEEKTMFFEKLICVRLTPS